MLLGKFKQGMNCCYSGKVFASGHTYQQKSLSFFSFFTNFISLLFQIAFLWLLVRITIFLSLLAIYNSLRSSSPSVLWTSSSFYRKVTTADRCLNGHPSASCNVWKAELAGEAPRPHQEVQRTGQHAYSKSSRSSPGPVHVEVPRALLLTPYLPSISHN